MELDDENLLPLSGSPNPLFLFAHPNNYQGEFITDIQVSRDYGLSITSKGKVSIHSIPSFEEICSKTPQNFVSCIIQNNENFIILHSTRPFIYNTLFSVTNYSLKRPPAQGSFNGQHILVNGSYCNNMLVGLTNSNALCLWDVRTDESPNMLTLPSNLNVQDVTINNDVIVIGHGRGFISELDFRNMKQRMNQIDISSQIIDLHSKNSQNKSFDHRFRLAKNNYEPWIIGFQFCNGPSGIVDLMSKKVTHQIDPPPYLGAVGNNKPRPIFYKNSFCAAYSWSNVIQVLNYTKYNYGYNYNNEICNSNDDDSSQGDETEDNSLSDFRKVIQVGISPISLAAHDDIDGIFAASAPGEIFRVF